MPRAKLQTECGAAAAATGLAIQVVAAPAAGQLTCCWEVPPLVKAAEAPAP